MSNQEIQSRYKIIPITVDDEKNLTIRYDSFDSIYGHIFVAATDKGICYLGIGDEPETVKDFIKVPRQKIHYIRYEEKRFHLPGTKIKQSKAMKMFEPDNQTHIGYYEEQTSLFKLKSDLVLRTG
jgi:hypothetical protein